MTDRSELEGVVEEKDRLIDDLRKQLDHEVRRLNRLVDIAGLLNSTLKLQDLLELIISSAAELLDAETSSLLLLDEDTAELTVEIATGEPGRAVMRERVPAGVGIAGWVIENAQPLIVDKPREHPRFYGEIDEKTGFETRNIVAVPMGTTER